MVGHKPWEQGSSSSCSHRGLVVGMVEGRDAASPKLLNLLVAAQSRDTKGDSLHV